MQIQEIPTREVIYFWSEDIRNKYAILSLSILEDNNTPVDIERRLEWEKMSEMLKSIALTAETLRQLAESEDRRIIAYLAKVANCEPDELLDDADVLLGTYAKCILKHLETEYRKFFM